MNGYSSIGMIGLRQMHDDKEEKPQERPPDN